MRCCTYVFISLCPAEMIRISAKSGGVCLCQCPQVAKSQQKHHLAKWHQQGCNPLHLSHTRREHKGCNWDRNRAPIPLPDNFRNILEDIPQDSKSRPNSMFRVPFSICPCFAGVWNKCFCIYSQAFWKTKCKPTVKQCATEMVNNANVSKTDGHLLLSLSTYSVERTKLFP